MKINRTQKFVGIAYYTINKMTYLMVPTELFHHVFHMPYSWEAFLTWMSVVTVQVTAGQ